MAKALVDRVAEEVRAGMSPGSGIEKLPASNYGLREPLLGSRDATDGR